MIGSAIKKYAEKHGLTCDGGYAYGKVSGRYIALEDGANVKVLHIYIYPPAQNTVENEEKLVRVRHALLDCDAKEYRLMKRNPVVAEAGRVSVVFQDMRGTMTRIERYIDEVLPRLNDLDLGDDVCAYCGEPFDGDAQVVLLDDYVVPVHPSCVQEMTAQIEAMESQPKPGSVLRGAVGALIGALLGAIPWAIAFMLGYVTSLFGLLIGFLSNWFYGKFGGKNNKLRVVVVILALIIGVGVGQVAGYTLLFAREYGTNGGFEETSLTIEQYILNCWDIYLISDEEVMLGNQYDRVVSNIPEEEQGMLYSREEFIQMNADSTYASLHQEALNEFLSNIGLGILFGVLGCLGVFAQLFKETQRRRVKALK